MARLLHAPPPLGRVGPRTAANRPGGQVGLALNHLLFPSATPVRSKVTCKEEKKCKQVSVLSLFRSVFYFCSLFLSFFFWFPLLCFRWPSATGKLLVGVLLSCLAGGGKSVGRSSVSVGGQTALLWLMEWTPLMLRRSEERAGSPLGSSLAPATERERRLLWSKGCRCW